MYTRTRARTQTRTQETDTGDLDQNQNLRTDKNVLVQAAGARTDACDCDYGCARIFVLKIKNFRKKCWVGMTTEPRVCVQCLSLGLSLGRDSDLGMRI